MDAGMFYIQQETKRYEARCSSAIVLVQRAKSMWEVRRAADVVAPSILRGMHLNRQGTARMLASQAEKKMSELLTTQLATAKALTSVDDRRAYIGKLRANEWDALRGDFSRLYQHATIEAQRILSNA